MLQYQVLLQLQIGVVSLVLLFSGKQRETLALVEIKLTIRNLLSTGFYFQNYQESITTSITDTIRNNTTLVKCLSVNVITQPLQVSFRFM